MTELLKNYVAGEWIEGKGPGTALTDPVTGEELVRVSSQGLDLPKAFGHARDEGGRALRALTYGERAALLGEIARVLGQKKDDYYAHLDVQLGHDQGRLGGRHRGLALHPVVLRQAGRGARRSARAARW